MRSSPVIVLGCLLAFLIAPSGSAQETVTWEQVQTDRGCLFYIPILHGGYGTAVLGGPSQGETYQWSEPCTAGELVSGTGTQTLTWPWENQITYTGPFVDGVRHGSIDIEFPDYPGEVNTFQYNMGCPVPSRSCSPRLAQQAAQDGDATGELTQAESVAVAEDADGREVSMTRCQATPDQTVAAFYADFTAFSNANPPPSQALGARAQYQWSYFLAEEALRRIEPLRACLGPHYDTLLRDYTAMSKTGKSGCDQLASGSEPCPATYPR